MVGKQVDEVSIEQSIIFRAGRWLKNKLTRFPRPFYGVYISQLIRFACYSLQ